MKIIIEDKKEAIANWTKKVTTYLSAFYESDFVIKYISDYYLIKKNRFGGYNIKFDNYENIIKKFGDKLSYDDIEFIRRNCKKFIVKDIIE
jgi:hypothetical protein